MTHKWEMDVTRTRMDISILVWKCKHCGCLQIKNGGVDASSLYKPNDPTWSPFKTLVDPPPCVTTPAHEKEPAGHT